MEKISLVLKWVFMPMLLAAYAYLDWVIFMWVYGALVALSLFGMIMAHYVINQIKNTERPTASMVFTILKSGNALHKQGIFPWLASTCISIASALWLSSIGWYIMAVVVLGIPLSALIWRMRIKSLHSNYVIISREMGDQFYKLFIRDPDWSRLEEELKNVTVR